MRRGAVRIGAIINIQHSGLGALAKNLVPRLYLILNERDSVADIRLQAAGIFLVLLQHRFIIQGLRPIELYKNIVLNGQVFPEPLRELLLINEITDPDADTVIPVFVAGANAILRGTHLGIALGFLQKTIQKVVVRKDNMGPVGNAHTADINALGDHCIHFRQHILRIKSYPVAHNAQGPLEKNP